MDMSQKYDDWETDCWVRTGPRYVLASGEQPARTFFPQDLVPYAAKVNRTFGEQVMQTVLIHCLFTYLRFTELLELKSINQVGNLIALNELPVDVPEDLRTRAFLLIRDEAHHAAASDDIAGMVERATGIRRLPPTTPHYMTRLMQVSAKYDREMQVLIQVAFSAISETLISGSLAQIPKDGNVVKLIRDYTQHHADD